MRILLLRIEYHSSAVSVLLGYVNSLLEQYIQEQLRNLPFDCTKFIIAQRISSMRDADLILVIQNGRVTQRGTHEELLAQKGYYWQTCCLQYGIPMDEGEVS